MYFDFINEVNKEIFTSYSNILKLILSFKYDLNIPVEIDSQVISSNDLKQHFNFIMLK